MSDGRFVDTQKDDVGGAFRNGAVSCADENERMRGVFERARDLGGVELRRNQPGSRRRVDLVHDVCREFLRRLENMKPPVRVCMDISENAGEKVARRRIRQIGRNGNQTGLAHDGESIAHCVSKNQTKVIPEKRLCIFALIC